jgi:diaminobutyrate-2-oxoglutarate transaminase
VSARGTEKIDFSELSLSGAPKIGVIPPGPKSRELLQYQEAHESSAVSYAKGMPMAVRRAKGATVEDVDGNLYIDCFGGAGVMGVGHANPEVLKAAHEQIDQVTHALDIPTPARMALEQVLVRVLPKALSRLFFGGPTGSDAVEQAMKLAKYNTGRIPFIAFEGGYHGMTAGALALTTASSHKEGLLPLVPEVHFTPYGYCYRCAFGRKPESCSMECTQYLDRLLEDPHSGVTRPAAVIVEPIQGEGGSIIPPEAFLPNVREICDRHEVLLICDEIQCGLGRTGKMFAFEHTGAVPDIVTMSKALGGLGFPISAIAYRDELNTWPTAKTIGTFRGNMIAYAAGARALGFMLESGLLEHTERLGQTALRLLKELEKDSRIIGEARGKGLMLGVEFVSDKETKKPAPKLAKRMRTLCHQRGVMIEVGGHYGNVARFLPPLVITEQLLGRAIEIFSEAVREIEKTSSGE